MTGALPDARHLQAELVHERLGAVLQLAMERAAPGEGGADGRAQGGDGQALGHLRLVAHLLGQVLREQAARGPAVDLEPQRADLRVHDRAALAHRPPHRGLHEGGQRRLQRLAEPREVLERTDLRQRHVQELLAGPAVLLDRGVVHRQEAQRGVVEDGSRIRHALEHVAHALLGGAQHGLGAPPRHELPDAGADPAQRRQQLRLGLLRLAAPEHDHAHELAAAHDREAEHRLEPEACGRLVARVVVLAHVGESGGGRLPHAARQPVAARVLQAAPGLGEAREVRSRPVPVGGGAQHVRPVVDLPELAQLAVQVSADRLQERTGGLGQGAGLGQDEGGRVLHAQDVLGPAVQGDVAEDRDRARLHAVLVLHRPRHAAQVAPPARRRPDAQLRVVDLGSVQRAHERQVAHRVGRDPVQLEDLVQVRPLPLRPVQDAGADDLLARPVDEAQPPAGVREHHALAHALQHRAQHVRLLLQLLAGRVALAHGLHRVAQRAPQLETGHHLAAQDAQGVALVRVQLARQAVHHAQGAHGVAVRRAPAARPRRSGCAPRSPAGSGRSGRPPARR